MTDSHIESNNAELAELTKQRASLSKHEKIELEEWLPENDEEMFDGSVDN